MRPFPQGWQPKEGDHEARRTKGDQDAAESTKCSIAGIDGKNKGGKGEDGKTAASVQEDVQLAIS